ncbi:MAG: DUF3391 domain-containing protein [Nitrospirae bacterium]|nr:DUF3391 domain-containing protein [Nitrospirota bacterium]MBF0534671.1 DUF3391 domain-containing protein [Nitrospirota bacterium]MBF0616285.1 DUF3391 domain-containing protein [Nitrospirota bacterium]
MKEKIPIEELKVGMYLAGLDENWEKTPFLTHHFLIKDSDQIRKLTDSGIKTVYVDMDKGQKHVNETPKELEQIKFLKKEEVVAAHSEFVELNEITPEVPEDWVQPLSSQPTYTKMELDKYFSDLNNYTPIDKETLIRGSLIDFSIYFKKNLEILPFLKYKDKPIEITDKILSLQNNFMIERSANERYKKYLKDLESFKASGTPEEIRKIKNTIIRENAKFLMMELLDDPRSGEKIKRCKQSIEEIVETIQKTGSVLSELLTINKYDYYTYTHSINVGVLSVGLAVALGTLKNSELQMLGMGAILHDIGKSAIPNSILNKPSRLTEKEYAVIKQHVGLGVKILHEQKTCPKDAFVPILEHHEKLSGTGYPRGLAANDIHMAGRIVSLVDVYDALTTARPYKPAYSSFEALSIIRNQIEDFDADIFLKFVKMLGNIP